MESNRSVVRGVVAGILAATAVIVFFFLFDLARGDLLATPQFLAATVLGQGVETIGGGTIAIYTVIHYIVFIALGVLVAWLVGYARLAPGLIVGVLLGLVFFDLMFYTGLVISGVDVLRELGWPWVLIGNLIAGLVMAGWLRYTSPYEVSSWREVLANHRIVREGIIAGLLGGGTVAVWFLFFDLVTRTILFTPAALGSALFYGAQGSAQVQITAGSVLLYTVLHFAAFIAIGMVAAAMLVLAQREPGLLIAFMLVFVTLEASLLGFLSLFANWILNSLGGWNVALGNLLSAAVMGWYLWKAHPELRERFRDSSRSLEDAAAA